MLKDILQRMNASLLTPPYNLIVHSAPLQEEPGANDFYHWHVEVMPKLTRVAGSSGGQGSTSIRRDRKKRRRCCGRRRSEGCVGEALREACDLALSSMRVVTLTGCRAGITQW